MKGCKERGWNMKFVIWECNRVWCIEIKGKEKMREEDWKGRNKIMSFGWIGYSL